MDSYLRSPKTEKFSKDGENARLRYGLSSMQGWRPTMEDDHAVYPDLDPHTSFFGVYDGHGGNVVAKFCAKYLHQQLLKSEAYPTDIGTSLQKSFIRMDDMMVGQRGWRELSLLGNKLEMLSVMLQGLLWPPRSIDPLNDWATEQGPHSSFTGPACCGCTACVAIIRHNQLIVANAGDSRCVISRNGQAHNMSTDHKPEVKSERERILGAGGCIRGRRVNGCLSLTRAIGDKRFKRNKMLPPQKQVITADPDIKIVDLRDGDEFIVVACDGIWDCMTSQELVDFIHEHLKTERKLSSICEKVMEKCLAPAESDVKGCDNMTIILVQLR